MECEYCGEVLEAYDTYGYFGAHQSGKKVGDILRCPNHEGFETEEDARKYAPEFPLDQDWAEIVCESSCHSVSGAFYTDKYGELHNGYPC